MFVKQFSQSINTLLLGSEATAQCMVLTYSISDEYPKRASYTPETKIK